MPRIRTLLCGGALGLLLAACEREPEMLNPVEPTASRNETIAPPAEPPPMIVRSAAYRCDDGGALYVDFLSDETSVAVRDSRQDTPRRLER